LAADLVRRQVAVIVALGTARPALVAKAVTSTIPIVFAMGIDAVEIGLVKSLNKPEANLTGVSLNSTELMPKRLELLHELVPQARLFGFLDNFGNATAVQRLVSAARSMGLEISVFDAGTEEEIERAFASMVQQGIQAVLVSADGYFNTRHEQIVALAKLHALPAMYSGIRAARVGGLIGYQVQLRVMFRQAGIYAGLILKGAKPADLPVQLPTRFYLNINLKTAKALGLTVPRSLLVFADEVIE
jgi:putative ABC transport system substrate-binding protein